jgi:hypothetical protein
MLNQVVQNENKIANTSATAIQSLVRGKLGRKKASQRKQAKDMVDEIINDAVSKMSQPTQAASMSQPPIPGAPGGMPPKGRSADEWKAWAVKNNLPLPHTKKDLVERYYK